MLLHILGLSHSFVSDVTFFSPKGALALNPVLLAPLGL
jgi:hypothetical protein